jgi:Putative amidoligase enzyme
LASDQDWKEEIDRVFTAIQDNFEIKLTNGCATHIHVSRGRSNQFELGELHKMAKAIIYYDQPFTLVMPPVRKDNAYAIANVKNNTELLKLSNEVPKNAWTPAFAKVHEVKMARSMMNVLFPKRQLAWNFEHVRAPCGTIEFRRPPGVKTSADAKHWISVVLGFTAHTLWQQDWGRVAETKTHPGVTHLAACINDGLRLLEPTSRGALGRIAEDRRPAWYPDEAEAAKIRKKILEKKSAFAVKVSSKKSLTKDFLTNDILAQAASRPNTPN